MPLVGINYIGLWQSSDEIRWWKGFLEGWDSKESAYNAGDPGLIPGLGRSPGEGNHYPLQYSYLENSMDIGAWQATVHGVAKSWTWLSFSFSRWWKQVVIHKVLFYFAFFFFFFKNKDRSFATGFDKFCLFVCLFKFYFIFKLYIIVLVLPNIKMNPSQVYMCSPSWTLLPPPSP